MSKKKETIEARLEKLEDMHKRTFEILLGQNRRICQIEGGIYDRIGDCLDRYGKRVAKVVQWFHYKADNRKYRDKYYDSQV